MSGATRNEEVTKHHAAATGLSRHRIDTHTHTQAATDTQIHAHARTHTHTRRQEPEVHAMRATRMFGWEKVGHTIIERKNIIWEADDQTQAGFQKQPRVERDRQRDRDGKREIEERV